MLACKGVSKRYATNGDVPPNGVLNNFSCDFSHNKVCIVGENGSGKSTLLLIIAGLLAPDAGSIVWQGKNHHAELRKQISALASDSIVMPGFLSAMQVLKLVQDTWQINFPTTLIEQFNFTPFLHTNVESLSTGNLKKLQLISALMRQTEILLLDEPNIALDQQSVDVLWQIIESYEGRLIVASNEPQLFARRHFTLQALHSN